MLPELNDGKLNSKEKGDDISFDNFTKGSAPEVRYSIKTFNDCLAFHMSLHLDSGELVLFK